MKLVEEATYGQVQMTPLPSRDERSFTQKLKDAWNDVDYQPVVEHVAGRPPKIECVIEFGADAPMPPSTATFSSSLTSTGSTGRVVRR